MFKVSLSKSEPIKPVGVLTICGSITTWGGLSPSFCVYEVDAETMLPVSRLTYSFNITKANQDKKIEWYQYTNWTSALQIDNLSPTSYHSIALKLLED